MLQNGDKVILEQATHLIDMTRSRSSVIAHCYKIRRLFVCLASIRKAFALLIF